MGEIYLIKCRVNGKGYVGQALEVLSNGRKHGSIGRWKTHLADLERTQPGCPLLTAAMKKHGVENFRLEIILQCNDADLNYYESKFVAAYNTLAPNGYNLNTGGGNGRRHSDATRHKMSNTRIGKHHSEDTRAKIGLALSDREVSNETRNRLSTTRKQLEYYKPENRAILEQLFQELGIAQLPQYITYMAVDPEGRGDGFQVRHPHGKKKFMSKKLSLVDKYQLAYTYLRTFNSATAAGELRKE